jgi:hypothetical protein|tara:strand:+ start:483 stop:932 length:450 start_codon:yes stop_codon:yes gene_type:complete
MKKVLFVLCIFSIIVFSVFSSEAFAQISQPEDGIFFMFVQVTLRNSDGNLVTYMESNKFFDVDKKIINDSLDHFSSSMEIPIFELNDTKFQVFIIESDTEFDSSTMFANAYYNVTIDDRTYSAARFQFDSFLTSPGDEVTAVWTIARLV